MNGKKLAIISGTIAALTYSTAGFGQELTPTPAPAPVTPPETQTMPQDAGKTDWSDRFSREFNEIQQRMESLFDRAWNESSDALRGITATTGGFASSLNLTEEDNQYIVRVKLPDRDIQKVDVRVDSDNMLHVIANEEQRRNEADIKGTAKDESLSAYSLSRYEQKIGLPGPVDSTKMTVNREGNTLTVTLPKSGTTPPSTD